MSAIFREVLRRVESGENTAHRPRPRAIQGWERMAAFDA